MWPCHAWPLLKLPPALLLPFLFLLRVLFKAASRRILLKQISLCSCLAPPFSLGVKANGLNLLCYSGSPSHSLDSTSSTFIRSASWRKITKVHRRLEEALGCDASQVSSARESRESWVVKTQSVVSSQERILERHTASPTGPGSQPFFTLSCVGAADLA